MKFEVVRKSDNKVFMWTTTLSCIPFEHLATMEQGGYRFRLDGKFVTRSQVNALNPTAPRSQSVSGIRCINNGKVYKNQAEAARDLHIDPAQVSDSIKTGRPRSGYTFERV